MLRLRRRAAPRPRAHHHARREGPVVAVRAVLDEAGDGVIDLRLGRWQDVLADVTCDALIFDAPYSKTTHVADVERADDYDAQALTPQYAAFSPDDVRAFCESWSERCLGWMVSITDSVLAPVWRTEMQRTGRYSFAPVPCVMRGMSVRMLGDGPSSWTVYAMVSRPSTKAFASWGTLDGAYTGSGKAAPGERGGGRGKPDWLMSALVRDYSRPGDLICDPFAGWGSTLAAASSLGRRAIGAEMDKDAHAEAVRRLRRPLQTDLFAGGAL